MTQWGLDTLFNPAKRHMDEEKRRLQSTREEVGDSSGGKRIDFESGKVRIRREETAGEEPAAANGAGGQESRSKDAVDKNRPEPSAAAIRAARRRGRTP